MGDDEGVRHARRYRTERSDVGGRKPEGGRDTPVRAWLEHQENGLPEAYRSPEDAAPWTLTIEDGKTNPAHSGAFERLVEIARRGGAVEFYVWSPARRTFVRADAHDISPLD